MAYTALLNGLLLGRFKFSLADSKVTTLVEALGRAQSLFRPPKYVSGTSPRGKRARRGRLKTAIFSLTNVLNKAMRGEDDGST